MLVHKLLCIRDIFNTEVSSLQGGWNRGVPLYTEVSSFQGVGSIIYRNVIGIEEFHCIQNTWSEFLRYIHTYLQ